ncbi:MAG TPA: adenylate/guanylate cyclase domain-containing protein [Actinomycetota bacterium]|nr:adenylate/guanylate cyclase domain-containing protein [Actinomycetota bacterium]
MTPHPAAPAGTTCPACGAGTPVAARFCPACGQRLLGEVEERRVVTVLFADLVDSTRLVESLDPEAARDLLNETFRRLAAEVRRFGGTLEKYIGDAIFAVFGFPTGHDDDAARAVRAALAMRDIVRTAETALGDLALRLRIGLDTGEVAAAERSGDLRVTGPAVHTAARIQQAAEPDQILLSARTLRAARDTAEVGPPARLEVRGQRLPVEVVEVLGLSPAEPATGPMVGREADLPRLIGALDHAAHHNRLVLLVGDAGVGKSTLARAVTAEIGDRVHVLWGRCLPDWQSLPFWPVREVLAAAAGLAPTEPAGVLSTSIHRLVADTWPDPVAAPATAESLCRLAGLEVDEPGPAAQPGPGTTRELAAALAGVLCGLARDERVLVVLEDLHWATRDLLEVASTLVTDGCRSQGQLAYLGISRPELPGLPGWLLRTGTQRIDLDPLAERPAAQLLATVLGADADPGLVGRVFDASKGNPLFVKELAIALREAGRAGPGQPTLPIPDSLQALVAARLDRLPLSAKRVLCRAAVVGRWFSSAALAAMAQPGDGELGADLDRLVWSGLIERLPERLAGGQERFAFHHALFRDVAYAILPKVGRSELHRRLAGWLAGTPGEEPSLPEVVAYHLVQAVRLAGEVRAPTAEDRELAARAVAACRRAARRLRDQEALDAAGQMLDDALGLAGVAGTAAEDEAELRLERGTVRGATGDLAGALADLGPATGSARPAVRARAWTELSNLHGMFGQYAESAAAADRAVVEAAEAGDPALIAQAIRAKAYVPYLAGDLAGAGRLLDEALGQARRAGQVKPIIELRATLLPLRLYLATPLEQVRAEAVGLAADARSAGRRSAEAAAKVTLGEVAWLQDDLDAAEGHFAEGNRLSLEVGFTRKRLWSLLGLTQVAIARGRPEEALALAREAIELTTQPDGSADVEAELHLAEACLAGGDLGGAAAAVARAWAVLQEVDVFSRARLQRTEARLAAASGDPERAVALLERSLAALEATGHGLDRLHSLTELALALRQAGRDEEAEAAATRARDEVAAIGAHALARRLVGAAASGPGRSRTGGGMGR